MICEREEEIAAFKPREYWTVDAEAEKASQVFGARLTEFGGEKVEQFTITTAERAEEVRRTLEQSAGGALTVTAVDKKQRKRNPSPPFTTSTLQQEAARKLGFGAQRTMRTAQRLYEGVDFGEGPVGLITYMRTDSVSLGIDAVREIRSTIGRLYGAEALPDSPRMYRTKSKNAQEAHEAIRPTSAARAPEQLAGKLDPDQHKLYTLIWRRAVASQMEAAVFDTVAVDLSAGKGHTLRANGSTLVKPGFLAVYRESFDDVTLDDDDDRRLPAFETGDRVKLNAIKPEQHFTEPPPRFSEASLVKALEEYGIGRPSTYASIIQTLLYKKYCELINKRFIPTDLGKIVNRFLTGNFERYVDFNFTAGMEDELDNISRGEDDWVQVLDRFWAGLKKQIDDVEANVTRSDVAMARDIGIDPASGRPVSVRYGKYGAFAQIGTRDDEEKPKFASLRPGQRMDDVTLADALELFKLPRTVGDWEDGYPIRVAVGRFGPYAQYGAKKYVSLKKEDDPYTDHARAGAAADPREARDRGEPHHPRVPGGRHPGAERPLRPVHHRRQEERQDPEGPGPEVADARGVPGVDRRGAGAQGTLGQEDGAGEGRSREDKGKDEVGRGRDGRRRREAGEEESCAEEEGGREEVCCKEESAGEERVVIRDCHPAGGEASCVARRSVQGFFSPQQSRDRQVLVQLVPANSGPAPDQPRASARCSGVEPSNRGNHANGVESVRPSSSVTMTSVSEHRTDSGTRHGFNGRSAHSMPPTAASGSAGRTCPCRESGDLIDVEPSRATGVCCSCIPSPRSTRYALGSPCWVMRMGFRSRSMSERSSVALRFRVVTSSVRME